MTQTCDENCKLESERFGDQHHRAGCPNANLVWVCPACRDPMCGGGVTIYGTLASPPCLDRKPTEQPPAAEEK